MFIWKAKGTESARCIYGKAVVEPIPWKGQAIHGERMRPYLEKPSKAEEWFKKPYFDVRYTKLVLCGPIWQSELINNGLLKPEYFRGRTYKLTEEKGKTIEALLDKHKGTVLSPFI